MYIKEIQVSDCTAGNILAADVTNSNGVTLVGKDTVMNEYLKDRLIELGAVSIRIYRHVDNNKDSSTPFMEFQRHYQEILLQTKAILNDLGAGRHLDFEKICSISEWIGKNLKENGRIISYLSEIRNADEYTYTHCINTAFYSMLIAKWLKMSDHRIQMAIQSGLLHDIGKARIPVEILNKKGILTREEYEVIKKHTTFGYEMLEGQDDIDPDIKKAVLLHHERVDGTGYPFKATSNLVNILSKIVSIADVFDAMTSDRPYKKRATPFEALEMFQTEGLVKFDIKVLRVFFRNMAAFLVGAKVVLSNGETGEIVFVPLQNLSSPIVRVSSGYLDLSQEKTIFIAKMI